MSTTPHSGSEEGIRQEAERTKSEAAQLASGAAEEAKERGREAADQAKDEAADRAERLASALDTTAEDLEGEGREGEALSGYGRSLAEMMRRFAGGLREHEIEEFAGELAGFARRNPASFLAGSVALGFGVSRFLKATGTRPPEDYEEEDELTFAGDEEELDLEERRAAAEAAGTETWPRDRGGERPGAASSSEHWTPVVSAEPPAQPEQVSAAGPESGTPSKQAETRRQDEIGRNEP